jgi:tRNA wybutosine-synthesizing protein 3
VSLSPFKNGELNPMVAVRSTGYSFDAIIGYQNNTGKNIAVVDEPYLRTLVNIANERFKVNNERIARFQASICEQYDPRRAYSSTKSDWEGTEARKRRKREEGLARQLALKTGSSDAVGDTSSVLSSEL